MNTSHNQNYPSSRGNNHHSTVVVDEPRATSSQGLNLKTFDNGSRNQGGAHSTNIVREAAKIGEPLRRKQVTGYANNNAQSNTRRIGDELRRIG